MVPQSPQSLLNLPLDILSEILDNLLPPLCANHGSSSLLALRTTPDPLDLFQVMRTCKALHHIALPWIYRRVHYYKEANAPTGRWKYLRDHQEAGIHVRLFIIDFRHDGQSLREGIAFLQPSMRFMDNLQVLVIEGATGLGPVISQAVREVLSKPRLEALLTSPLLAAINIPCPRSLRHLSCEDHDLRGWILEAIPQLESLAISSRLRPDSSNRLETLPISWDRLRRLDIGFFQDWFSLLDDFAAWKRESNTPSPLMDVSIYNSIRSDDRWRIIESFSGQNLQTLSLVYVRPIDEVFLEKLVQAFPQLRLLRLCSYRLCCPWDVGLSAIAGALGRLNALTHLQWNYIDGPHKRTRSHQDPHLLLALSALAEHSRSLKRIQFLQLGKMLSFTRSGDGVFEAEEGSPFQYSGSSWPCSMYGHL